MQPRAELEAFWSTPDPWGFHTHPDDQTRLVKLLAALPRIRYRRALDLGCGDGFVARHLPADEVVGLELAENALVQARERSAGHPGITYVRGSLFDLPRFPLGAFDLVVASGVLYRTYLGDAGPLVGQILADALAPEGECAVTGIEPWLCVVPPLTLLHRERYPYRQWEHRLEIWRNVS